MKQVKSITAYDHNGKELHSWSLVYPVSRVCLEYYIAAIKFHLRLFWLNKIIVSYQEGIEVFLVDQL